MKTCIWCRKTEPQVSFLKLAHTIPRSLGGKHVCENVCDDCNAFFGNHHNSSPSVEAIIKETFNIARVRFLDSKRHVGKNKALPKFTSIYFNVDLKKHKVELKLSYRLQKGFQEKIGRQLKKGLYKLFLEESDRKRKDGLDPKYDFIREFARYDLGDYPVFYFDRLFGIIATAEKWIVDPEIFFEPDEQSQYLVDLPGFFEFELLGHVIAIATSRYWEITYDHYIKETSLAKKQFFRKIRVVNNFNDIDLALSILDDHHRP